MNEKNTIILNNVNARKIEVLNSRSERYLHIKPMKKINGLDLVQLGHHITEPLYAYGPVVRDHFLIHFIMKGSGHVIVGEEKYIVHKGEAFLIRPYEIGSYISDKEDPWEYCWVGFTGFDARWVIEKTGFAGGNVVIETTYISEIAETVGLAGEVLVEEESYMMLYQSIIYRVLHYLVKERVGLAAAPGLGHNLNSGLDYSRKPKQNSNISTANPRRTGRQDYVRQLIAIIEASYGERLVVSELADSFNINRNYLNKIFKEEIGVSIKRFILQYRMDMAAAMIRRSEKNLKEIAAEVGFEDPLYFSRFFKKQFGMSPSEFGRT